jgi:hypothetical protein
MTATVTKAGPYYSSGAISFGSLRSNFKESAFGPISASELRRNTSTSNTDPIVPDSIENTNISTSIDLKLSQFRNSIKYYYITQTGTDVNFNISNQDWNGNLNKNIRKWMFMNGTCGSNSISLYAASFDASTTYNLTIDVSGGIYGAGGSNGTSATISGGNGGNALFVNSSVGNNIVVFLRSTGNIYSGGGGGEKGINGLFGSSGTCYSTSTSTETFVTGNRCRSCPDCPSGWNRIDCYQREGRCDWRGQFRKSVCQRTVTITTPYAVGGAPGGAGGDGGLGQGYNQTRTNGSGGALGTPGGCPSYGSTGQTGETGGNGGDWGQGGGFTSNSGQGGASGRAISGSNYTVTGALSASTIRGAY